MIHFILLLIAITAITAITAINAIGSCEMSFYVPDDIFAQDVFTYINPRDAENIMRYDLSTRRDWRECYFNMFPLSDDCCNRTSLFGASGRPLWRADFIDTVIRKSIDQIVFNNMVEGQALMCGLFRTVRVNYTYPRYYFEIKMI